MRFRSDDKSSGSRDETKWYPHFPIFFPVKIDGYWYWLEWVEERYTGTLTGQDGEKIYEYRTRRESTPPNGPVRILNGWEYVGLILVLALLFIPIWNYFHKL